MRSAITFLKLGALFIALGISSLSQAASFDCKKAATKVEKLVCADASLSKLDEEMNAAYKVALQDKLHADFIRVSQRVWVQQRDASCIDRNALAECVSQFYQRRLSVLKIPITTSPTGKPITARHGHTATLLPNGKVLIAGGQGQEEQSDGEYSLHSAELYDPAKGTFAATGELIAGRFEHTATLLQNGKVLMIGGISVTRAGPHSFRNPVKTGELYDPDTGIFTAIKGLELVGTPTLLADGNVLLINAVEARVYNPSTGLVTDSVTIFANQRDGYSINRLPSGKFLIVGGAVRGGVSGYTNLVNAEIYDSAANTFVATGNLTAARATHSATALPDGAILIAGGNFVGQPLATAELYDEKSGRFFPVKDLVSDRNEHSATLLPNGKVLIGGGVNRDGYIGSLELYDPITNAFTAAGRLSFLYGCPKCTATLLNNNKVLFVNGDVAELYDASVGRK